VLVTGAAGFIGSHVADQCLAQGFEVVGVDDLSGGYRENISDGVDFRQGSVTDEKFVSALFKNGTYDYVYHLAAYAAEGLSHFIRVFNYQTNLVASMRLINQSILHGVKCFVFTSSIAVYGANQTPMTEELTPMPEDPYGVSKYAVELDLQAARHMFGLDFIIFRPHNVYGERQNIADKYRNVIGIFMNQVMRHEPMTIFGDGEQTRAFSHIDDVAPLIARSPLVQAAYGEVFNVGADQPYTVNALAQEVAAAFDVEAEINHLPARREVIHAFATHDKARLVLGSPEAVTLRDGVGRMASWARARGPMTPVRFDEVEVARNLPPSWADARQRP